jgi:hypothetical protein
MDRIDQAATEGMHMIRTTLCASALCLVAAQPALAGALEEPQVAPPVIVEDMASQPDMSGKVLVIMAGILVLGVAGASGS